MHNTPTVCGLLGRVFHRCLWIHGCSRTKCPGRVLWMQQRFLGLSHDEEHHNLIAIPLLAALAARRLAEVAGHLTARR